MLNTASRPRIPENVLQQCRQDDVVVVENILVVCVDILQCVNIGACSIKVQPTTYEISIPISLEGSVSLGQMRQLEQFNPSRIHEVCVRHNTQGVVLELCVGNEENPRIFCETDVIRISKRKR